MDAKSAPLKHKPARTVQKNRTSGPVIYPSKARHTVGTHTGTKPNSRHLPQVTASKPSSGQPAAGSEPIGASLEGCANRLGGIHQVTQRSLGLLVITSLQTTARVHPQVSNGAVPIAAFKAGTQSHPAKEHRGEWMSHTPGPRPKRSFSEYQAAPCANEPPQSANRTSAFRALIESIISLNSGSTGGCESAEFTALVARRRNSPTSPGTAAARRGAGQQLAQSRLVHLNDADARLLQVSISSASEPEQPG